MNLLRPFRQPDGEQGWQERKRSVAVQGGHPVGSNNEVVVIVHDRQSEGVCFRVAFAVKA